MPFHRDNFTNFTSQTRNNIALNDYNSPEEPRKEKRSLVGNSIILNLVIIVVVAAIGLWISYISIALFTKHGQKDIVPNVENKSYTEAIKKLHAAGFKIDIRDSLYREDIKPGYVIEQFPKAKSVVKPGRKIFLYINAVNPKQVEIDGGPNHNEDALKGVSLRQGISRLEELGFKNIQIIKVLGETDRIVKVLSNGRTVKKGDKVPVNSRIIIEVYDGRLRELRDSLQNEELSRSGQTYYYNLENGEEGYMSPEEANSPSYPAPSENQEEQDEEPEYEFVE